jgi:SAM-dependent methyltransferase
LNGVGHSLERCADALDFGCGCGRTIRWLIERFPRTAFWGADVDPAAVAWCERHLQAHFAANAALPPLPFPPASFDCVYAISVFTHLRAEHQQTWLAEFQRVLRPGGILLLSLHGAGAQGGLDSPDVETLRTCGFLFKQSSKLQGIHPDWYQTSFHTEEYVARNFSGAFQVLAYNRLGLGYQDMVILQRA